MNIKEYIESGILELFALDQLDPAERAEVSYYLSLYDELRQELWRIETTLEKYAADHHVMPRKEVKRQVFDSIENLMKEQKMNPNDLPLLNKYSNYHHWQRLINSLGEFPIGEDGRHLRLLRQDEEVIQMLVVAQTDIEVEEHANEYESFLILKGACKCTVGQDVRLMSAGDFMEIPLFVPHDVQLISPQVTAILQRVKV